MRRGADSRLARAHDGGCVQDTCKTHARHLQDICKTRARRASETRPVCVRTETRCNGVLKLFVNYSRCSLTKSSDTPLQRVSVRTETGRVSDAGLARVLQMSCRCLACVLHASCRSNGPTRPCLHSTARRPTSCANADPTTSRSCLHRCAAKCARWRPAAATWLLRHRSRGASPSASARAPDL